MTVTVLEGALNGSIERHSCAAHGLQLEARISFYLQFVIHSLMVRGEDKYLCTDYNYCSKRCIMRVENVAILLIEIRS